MPEPAVDGETDQAPISADDDVRVIMADDHPVFRDGLAALLDSVAGIRVLSMGDVLQIVEAHLPGQTVAIRARQQGHVRTFTVKLGSRTVSAPH